MVRESGAGYNPAFVPGWRNAVSQLGVSQAYARPEGEKALKRVRNLCIGALLLAFVVFGASGCGQTTEQAGEPGEETTAVGVSVGGVEAPMFEVDPFWPKPLPNDWIIGQTIGVSVDSQDHVWVIHRQASLNARPESGALADPPTSECCFPAPNVLEFDQAGNLVGHWGGPGEGYDWPQSNHGITVDHIDNVWIGGSGEEDSHLLKFSRDGTFLLQVGRPGHGVDSNSTEHFAQVAKIFVDPNSNEAYVADGYGNRRVVVLDANTGEFKRYWGAYGNRPNDTDFGRYDPDAPPAQQFRNPVHCAMPSNDGFLYVCDRQGNRIQVFRTDGTFVDEVIVAKQTRGSGSAWDLAFSRDPEQSYIYLADGTNEKIHIIQRDTLEVLKAFGDGGLQPGLFHGLHSIATDSQGNIYTTETYEGKRLQKLVYEGTGPVPAGPAGNESEESTDPGPG